MPGSFLAPILKLLVDLSTFAGRYIVAGQSVGTLIGLPLGVFLATSQRGELFAAPAVNAVLGLIVNAARSTPFIIPRCCYHSATRISPQPSIGTSAAIVPLTDAAAPFIARVIEARIRGVDQAD